MPAAPIDVGGHFHESLLAMILDAGLMVQFILLLLLIFSIVSWTIIIMKYRVLRRVAQENESFLRVYMKSTKLADLVPEAKRLQSSTVAEVFRAAYGELTRITRVGRGGGKEEEALVPGELRRIDNIERAVNQACGAETTKLEAALSFLATTGSASPFIGLFGTVWGIMVAFEGIGRTGSASLAVVAPGISEALRATAIGLIAAIPAVMAYNHFQHKIRVLVKEMDSFSTEFLNIVQRNITGK